MITKRAQIAWMLFLCLCLLPGTSLGNAVDSTSAHNNYKELQSNLDNFKDESSRSHPDPVRVSSQGTRSDLFGEMLSRDPVDEKIVMNGSHSREQVKDLVAMNTVAQRDITCEDVQTSNLEDQDQGNSMSIEIAGSGQSEQDAMAGFGPNDDLGDAIEEKVNAATAFDLNRAVQDSSGSSRYLSNNMKIDVHGITVTATNTVPGGSAVATSNIKIEPVQIIMNPSEVSEKLK
jgi:hypothetical protein